LATPKHRFCRVSLPSFVGFLKPVPADPFDKTAFDQIRSGLWHLRGGILYRLDDSFGLIEMIWMMITPTVPKQ
jgi:hypothetical protein